MSPAYSLPSNPPPTCPNPSPCSPPRTAPCLYHSNALQDPDCSKRVNLMIASSLRSIDFNHPLAEARRAVLCCAVHAVPCYAVHAALRHAAL